MPKKMERKLITRAKAKGLKKGSAAYGRYVYGTLQKTGWKPSGRKRSK